MDEVANDEKASGGPVDVPVIEPPNLAQEPDVPTPALEPPHASVVDREMDDRDDGGEVVVGDEDTVIY